ncbi:GyrI-like domain-containing protein [Candidatus Saccharibacteria bacterium]|nr:MAG: GyrI-like domain-containing protein [Candidatus Saccharibacteria bacterium]
MNKTDYKKELKHLFSGKVGKPVAVQVPKMNFIMIDGKGDPNISQEYIDAIQSLYPVAYTIKFISKLKYGNDFGVMPLEGLWWTENMADFSPTDKSNWLWTAMIMQPDVITEDIYNQAVQQVREKKSPRSLDKVRFESYDEGRAAQVMYVGPYAYEGPTIQELHQFISDQGGKLEDTNKHHHEIYLGDARRTAPEKLKTIIRQPF